MRHHLLDERRSNGVPDISEHEGDRKRSLWSDEELSRFISSVRSLDGG
jgi:hypothetical protein